MTIEELKARLAELNGQATAIQANADAEKRDLTADEASALGNIFEEFEDVEADIARREKLAAQSARANKLGQSQGRQAQAAAAPEPGEEAPRAGRDGLRHTTVLSVQDRGRWGWNAFGDFAAAVKAASKPGSQSVDPRLMNAPTSYGNESTGADGGFAVPPEFRATIMAKVMGEDQLISRCDQIETGSNSVTVPKDETTPWAASGGVQAYWDGEAAQMTQVKPSLEPATIRLHRLTALVPVTDELLEDAPALGSYLNRKAPEVMQFKVNDAIVNGTGAGMPLGIMNAGCTVSVAKETSQAAATILSKNIHKMWSRMYAPWRNGAVWLINQDVEPQLNSMALGPMNVAGTENLGGVPVYMPPGGLSNAPYGTLLGKPIIPVQSCQTLGTVGDIVFASLSQYAAALKAGGIKSDSSIHLFFDYNMTTFRFVFRMGGQPWWSSSVSPKNGSNTLGAFVTLATRS